MKPLSKLAPFPAWLRLSQHLARLGGAGLLCALLLGAAGSARASLVYQLDITGPSVQATGSITTDGSLGTLDVSDILAWSIDVSSPLTGSLSSAAGNHMACFGAGCGLVATADGQLKFDFAPGHPPRTVLRHHRRLRCLGGPGVLSGGGQHEQPGQRSAG